MQRYANMLAIGLVSLVVIVGIGLPKEGSNPAELVVGLTDVVSRLHGRWEWRIVTFDELFPKKPRISEFVARKPAAQLATSMPTPTVSAFSGWPVLPDGINDASLQAFNGKLVTLVVAPYRYDGVKDGDGKALCLIKTPQHDKVITVFVPCWRLGIPPG